MKATAAILALLLAPFVSAAGFEVAVAGSLSPCGPLAPPPRPLVEWLGPEPVAYQPVWAIAAAPGGRVYGLLEDSYGSSVVRLYESRATVVLATIAETVRTSALTVDRAGNVYVLGYDRQHDPAVFAIDTEGRVRATHKLGFEYEDFQGGSIDLASDQCTLFIADENTSTIRRLNVCTGERLADFVQMPPPPPAGYALLAHIQVLPDGGLLAGYGTDLHRFDGAGVLTRTYHDVLGGAMIGAFGLERDGTTLWVGGGGVCTRDIAEFDLEAGRVLSTRRTQLTYTSSVVPFEVWTAATSTSAAVPPRRYDAAVLTGSDGQPGRFLEWVRDSSVVASERLSWEHAQVAPAADGTIRIATPIASTYQIEDLRRDGRREFYTSGLPFGRARLLTVDRAGATYVIAGGSTAGGAGIWRHSPDGKTYDRPLDPNFLPQGALQDSLDFDLAADQCTLFAIEHPRVRRLDVCTGKYLSDFLPFIEARNLRILPDGGLLLATADILLRYAASGALTRTYLLDRGTLGPLALADRGRTVWLGAGQAILELDLATGTILSTVPLQRPAYTIVPADVWTAATGTDIGRRRAAGRR